MSKPKWWTDAYDKMTNPLEKFGYLVGLSDMTWEDCCDAWHYSVKLLPEIQGAISDLEWQRDEYKRAAEDWMAQYDALKAKYEPTGLVLSNQDSDEICEHLAYKADCVSCAEKAHQEATDGKA